MLRKERNLSHPKCSIRIMMGRKKVEVKTIETNKDKK